MQMTLCTKTFKTRVITSDQIAFQAAWRLTSRNHGHDKMTAKWLRPEAGVPQPLWIVKGWTAISSLKWGNHFKMWYNKNAVALVSSKIDTWKKGPFIQQTGWQPAQQPACLSRFILGTSASSHRPNASTEGTWEPSGTFQLLGDADLYGIRYTIADIKVCIPLILSV